MVSSRTALLTLASAVAAQNSTNCPAGFVEGFNSQVLDIVAEPADVWGLIGDFGNLSWAGVAQTNLSDLNLDNVPGVMRTSIQLGFFINETLLAYSPFDEAQLTASELHSVAPFSTAPLLNTTVSAYADALSVSPLCGGAATRLMFNVNFCADPTYSSIVDSLFTTAHSSQLLMAQTILGAQNYTESICVGGSIVNSTSTTGTSTNGTSTVTSVSTASGASSGAVSGNGSGSGSGSGAASTATSTSTSGGTTAGSAGSSNITVVTSLPVATSNSAATFTASLFGAFAFVLTSLMI